MAEATVQLPPDSTGTKLRTLSDPAVASGAHQQVVTIADGSGALSPLAKDATLRDGSARIGGTVAVSGPLTDAQLRAASVVISGTVAVSNPGLTDTQLRAAAVPVSGPLTDAQLRAASVPVSGPLTDSQLRSTPVGVKDDYVGGEVLADQTGAGAVLTFTFTAPRQLVVLQAVGASQVARADPFGGTPTASLGIRCDDGVPAYLPITTSTVRVFAPSGMVVSVAGFSR